jgi:hypothetical protein
MRAFEHRIIKILQLMVYHPVNYSAISPLQVEKLCYRGFVVLFSTLRQMLVQCLQTDHTFPLLSLWGWVGPS